MTIALDDFQALQRDVEEINRLRAEKRGALHEITRRLKEEYKAKNLDHAERLLKEARADREEAGSKYQAAKEAFERDFAKELAQVRGTDQPPPTRGRR
jgi:predicted transcriptional regulator